MLLWTTVQLNVIVFPPDDDSKDNDSKPNNYECYPPIGPMGEMGKVFRGELPPEAIKPAPQKTDLSRIYGVGEYITPLPSVHHLPAALKRRFFDLILQIILIRCYWT